MADRQYYELDGFEEVYLEDSWVLKIVETEDRIEFEMETVLTEKHPLYTPQKKGEQYCYRKARIVFPGLRGVIWYEHRMAKARAVDANGTVDYGNIDSFFEQDGAYHLEGSWGHVTIVSGAPQISMDKT